MKKILAVLLTFAMLLMLTSTALADGIGFTTYENVGGENEETYEYTGKIIVGKGDVDGHCGAGTIVMIKNDGTTVQGNGLILNGGAKVETVELNGKLRAGTQDFNTQVGGSLTVAGAAATAGAVAGIGNDGKLQVNAQVGAEANLLEANANLGATVGGVEFGVKAGVKVGIGAKAKVGYDNGKLHLELGAALGIGGTVAVELDVGALANKSVDLAKKAWNAIKFW